MWTRHREKKMNIFSFGKDNNYKTSQVRAWLQKTVRTAASVWNRSIRESRPRTLGSTAAGAFSQTSGRELARQDIGFQLMNDQLFCLSLEEALAYREYLWRFDSGDDNPQSQVSAYSQGYYLRTPFYLQDENGKFIYNQQIYGVDLVNGCLRPVRTDSETYGVRPAFALSQM